MCDVHNTNNVHGNEMLHFDFCHHVYIYINDEHKPLDTKHRQRREHGMLLPAAEQRKATVHWTQPQQWNSGPVQPSLSAQASVHRRTSSQLAPHVGSAHDQWRSHKWPYLQCMLTTGHVHMHSITHVILIWVTYHMQKMTIPTFPELIHDQWGSQKITFCPNTVSLLQTKCSNCKENARLSPIQVI